MKLIEKVIENITDALDLINKFIGLEYNWKWVNMFGIKLRFLQLNLIEVMEEQRKPYILL
jgi:hypothetical protein